MNSSAMIIGWAHSKFGKSEYQDTESLIASILPELFGHANVSENSIDGIFLGVMNNGFSQQDFQAGLFSSINADFRHTPAIRVENACATGSAAIYQAMQFIDSGRGKLALVVGVEKMTNTSTHEVSEILLGASYIKKEYHPAGFAGVFSKVASDYFHKYGDKSYELACISSKNHQNAMNNPYAHFHKQLSIDFCHNVSDKNPYVSSPLRRTDCSAISDGVAAIILAHKDIALNQKQAIKFKAHQQINDFLPINHREESFTFTGAEIAWRKAFQQSSLNLMDLDLVETHDCFTIAELLEYEAMGLTKKGEGYKAIQEGWVFLDGKLPINPSGGLKAKGHPIGATGVSQHVMACMQLTETAGKMQIPNAKLAGVFNMGGIATTNYVSILEREK